MIFEPRLEIEHVVEVSEDGTESLEKHTYLSSLIKGLERMQATKMIKTFDQNDIESTEKDDDAVDDGVDANNLNEEVLDQEIRENYQKYIDSLRFAKAEFDVVSDVLLYATQRDSHVFDAVSVQRSRMATRKRLEGILVNYGLKKRMMTEAGKSLKESVVLLENQLLRDFQLYQEAALALRQEGWRMTSRGKEFIIDYSFKSEGSVSFVPQQRPEARLYSRLKSDGTIESCLDIPYLHGQGMNVRVFIVGSEYRHYKDEDKDGKDKDGKDKDEKDEDEKDKDGKDEKDKDGKDEKDKDELLSLSQKLHIARSTVFESELFWTINMELSSGRLPYEAERYENEVWLKVDHGDECIIVIKFGHAGSTAILEATIKDDKTREDKNTVFLEQSFDAQLLEQDLRQALLSKHNKNLSKQERSSSSILETSIVKYLGRMADKQFRSQLQYLCQKYKDHHFTFHRKTASSNFTKDESLTVEYCIFGGRLSRLLLTYVLDLGKNQMVSSSTRNNPCPINIHAMLEFGVLDLDFQSILKM